MGFTPTHVRLSSERANRLTAVIRFGGESLLRFRLEFPRRQLSRFTVTANVSALVQSAAAASVGGRQRMHPSPRRRTNVTLKTRNTNCCARSETGTRP